jgi:phosphoribosylanthranilate isomerase
MPAQCRRVGVFVDASIDDIRQHVADYALDIVQLHGHEGPDFVRALRADVSSPVIVKAFNIATKVDLEAVKPYEGIVDYFLFETRCSIYGGCGKKFDWDILQSYEGHTPFLLTGGIKSTDAERIKAFHHPQFAGIDLNSGFETAPAMKDTTLLLSFLSQITP